MTRTRDPFERAVGREQRLRKRAAAFETRAGAMRMVFWWFAVLIAGWALLLAGHWVAFPEPRWLAVLHTVVFAITVGYWLIAAAFVTSMKRRRPDLFDEDE